MVTSSALQAQIRDLYTLSPSEPDFLWISQEDSLFPISSCVIHLNGKKKGLSFDRGFLSTIPDLIVK